MRILIIGASGFIGSHVAASGRAGGLEVVPLRSIRVDPAFPEVSHRPVDVWRKDNPDVFDRLCGAVSGADAVVNAAGLAGPGSADRRRLLAANALQPAIVAGACSEAGVPRLVHVSTASVQGRMDPLDESDRHQAFSPYAASKAEGERLLLDDACAVPPEVVVYRPASVHGPARSVTKALVRLSGAPAVPVSDGGEQPLPVALVDNVAAGIVFAATKLDVEPGARVVVLHPSEDMTVRSLLESFGARRLLSLPPRTTRRIVLALRRASRRSALLSSRVRWVELLWLGQSVRSERLSGAGFSPPVGPDGWVALADTVRNGAPAPLAGRRA